MRSSPGLTIATARSASAARAGAAERARPADGLADHGGREAVPDGMRDDRPAVAAFDPQIRPRASSRSASRGTRRRGRCDARRTKRRVSRMRRLPARRAAALAASPQPPRSRPDPQRGHVLPAELADEDRAGHRIREAERPRGPGIRGLALVVQLERREDAAAARRRCRDGVHGERGEPLAHLRERHGERTERRAVVLAGLVQDPRPGRVAIEPPVELGGRHRRAVGLLHQREKLVAPRRLDDHFDPIYFELVPSAALKTLRARVPVTVSLIEIKSHAPASTSSKVRGEYGSTL